MTNQNDRQHGEWIIHPHSMIMKCSLCGNEENAKTVGTVNPDKHFCSFCGSDMRKGGSILESSAKTQGEWILKETDCDDGGNNRYECSECHFTDIHSDSVEVPFCWHCGTRMKGGVK